MRSFLAVLVTLLSVVGAVFASPEDSINDLVWIFCEDVRLFDKYEWFNLTRKMEVDLLRKVIEGKITDLKQPEKANSDKFTECSAHLAALQDSRALEEPKTEWMAQIDKFCDAAKRCDQANVGYRAVLKETREQADCSKAISLYRQFVVDWEDLWLGQYEVEKVNRCGNKLQIELEEKPLVQLTTSTMTSTIATTQSTTTEEISSTNSFSTLETADPSTDVFSNTTDSSTLLVAIVADLANAFCEDVRIFDSYEWFNKTRELEIGDMRKDIISQIANIDGKFNDANFTRCSSHFLKICETRDLQIARKEDKNGQTEWKGKINEFCKAAIPCDRNNVDLHYAVSLMREDSFDCNKLMDMYRKMSNKLSTEYEIARLNRCAGKLQRDLMMKPLELSDVPDDDTEYSTTLRYLESEVTIYCKSVRDVIDLGHSIEIKDIADLLRSADDDIKAKYRECKAELEEKTIRSGSRYGVASFHFPDKEQPNSSLTLVLGIITGVLLILTVVLLVVFCYYKNRKDTQLLPRFLPNAGEGSANGIVSQPNRNESNVNGPNFPTVSPFIPAIPKPIESLPPAQTSEIEVEPRKTTAESEDKNVFHSSKSAKFPLNEISVKSDAPLKKSHKSVRSLETSSIEI